MSPSIRNSISVAGAPRGVPDFVSLLLEGVTAESASAFTFKTSSTHTRFGEVRRSSDSATVVAGWDDTMSPYPGLSGDSPTYDPGTGNDRNETLSTWLGNDTLTLVQDRDGTGNGHTYTAGTEPEVVLSDMNGYATLKFTGSEYLESDDGAYLSGNEGQIIAVYRLRDEAVEGTVIWAAGRTDSTDDYIFCGPNGTPGDPKKLRFSVKAQNNTDRQLGLMRQLTNFPSIVSFRSDGTSYRMQGDFYDQRRTMEVDQEAGGDNGKWIADMNALDNHTIGCAIRTSGPNLFAKVDLVGVICFDTLPTASQESDIDSRLRDTVGLPSQRSVIADLNATDQKDTHSIRVWGGSNQYAASADRGGDTVDIWDTSDPTDITLLASINDRTQLNNTHYTTNGPNDTYLYTQAAATEARFTVVDISTPSSPSIVASIQDTSLLTGAQEIVLDTAADIAYITGPGDNAIVAVDISTPTSPTIIGSVTGGGGPNYLNAVRHLSLDQNNLILYAGSGDPDRRLTIWDVSAQDGTFSKLGDYTGSDFNETHEVRVNPSDRNVVYAAQKHAGDNTKGVIHALDVSDPANVAVHDKLVMDTDQGIGEDLALDGVHGLYIDGDTLWASSQLLIGATQTTNTASIIKIDISDPTVLNHEWSYSNPKALASAQQAVPIDNRYVIAGCHEVPSVTVIDTDQLPL